MADDLVLKIRTDATDAAKGLKPLTDGLNNAEREAAEAAKSLDKLDSMKVTPEVDVKMHDEAIKRARDEIARLRDDIARDVELGADTRPAQRRIAELQSAIKKLDDQPVRVKVDTAGLDASGAAIGGVRDKMDGLNLAGLGLVSRLGVGKAGIAGAALAAGGALAGMAADMETASLQMQSVIRDGGNVAAILADIKAYGATSPFEFPELQQAAKTLASFGVASSTLVDTLKNLGEVAAATGAPVSDLALIYGQMLAKGKIQSEELLQFAERGVPVFEALGNALGVSADQARVMAEEGKLGRAEIEKLDDAMGAMFAGSTARQAETFNGQLSTLKDNTKALGTSIGEDLLPGLTGLLDVLNQLMTAASEENEFSRWVDDTIGARGFSDDLREELEMWGLIEKKTNEEIAKSPPVIKAQTEAVYDLEKGVADANDEFGAMIDALHILNADFLSAREATSAYQASVDDLAASIVENGRTLDLNTEAGRNNDAAVREQAASIAALADARLRDMQTSGETTEQITGDYEKQRQGLVDTMVQMGLTKTQAEAYATQLLKTPKELKTTASLIIPPEFITKLNYISGEKTLTITPKMNEADALRIEKRIGAIIFGPTPGSPSGNSAPPVPPGRVGAPAVTLTNRVRVYVDGASVAGAIRADVSTAAGSAAREAVAPRRL